MIGLITKNFIVDPFGRFGMPVISRLNEITYEAGKKERRFKLSKSKRMQPDLLVLGTSREDYGINPDDIPIGSVKSNGATVSQPYRESRLNLDYLSEHEKYPKHILLGLLFEISDVNAKRPNDFNENKLYNNGLEKYSDIFSMYMVKASVKTLSKNLFRVGQAAFNSNGLRAPQHFISSLNNKGQHKIFVANERHYMKDNHYPLPLCRKHQFVDEITGYSKMEEIRALLRLAYGHRSDLRMFIGPSHARQWMTINVSGLWEKFEEWKQKLVIINEEEAFAANTVPFPIWDFSGFNTLTSEPVPSDKDKKSRMKYYFESSHYTPALGKLVVRKIYGVSDNSSDDFGVQISSQNIQKHMELLRRKMLRWGQKHPSDVSEIRRVKEDVDRVKGCEVPLTN